MEFERKWVLATYSHLFQNHFKRVWSTCVRSNSDEDNKNTSDGNEQTHFTQIEQETPLENTVLSEENLSGPNKDGPKENREGMGRNIIGKRPVQKEVVKQSGPKRQKNYGKGFWYDSK